jgi:glycosyltransferase involved in cell wall biosynthesis
MAEPRPLVSVIIPCYNQAHFVTEAIDSAVSQTWKPLEIVVVNDGSKDNTSEVVQGYGGLLRLVEQENSGLSAARNAAIAASKGEFILLLDSDDMLLPGCVESRMSHMRDEIGIVCGAFEEVDEKGRFTKVEGEQRRLPPDKHFEAALRGNYGPPSGWLIRRRAVELCGQFDPHLKSCEDWDMLTRICKRFKAGYDPTPQVRYRQVPTSMSRNQTVMYDAAAMMYRKNRMLGESRLAYWWNSQVGMFNHCAGNILARPMQEHGAKKAVGMFLRLGMRRPMVLVYFGAWVVRALRNRVMWIFGRGPLRPRA